MSMTTDKEFPMKMDRLCRIADKIAEIANLRDPSNVETWSDRSEIYTTWRRDGTCLEINLGDIRELRTALRAVRGEE